MKEVVLNNGNLRFLNSFKTHLANVNNNNLNDFLYPFDKCSLFMSSLVVPFSLIPNDVQLATEISLMLSDAILQRCKDFFPFEHKKRALRFMLLRPDSDGFTPIFPALKHAALADYYLHQLEAANKENFISNEEYAIILSTRNSFGFTPLQRAISTGQSNIIRMFFQVLERGLDSSSQNQILKPRAVGKMLVTYNHRGFSPLHDTLCCHEDDLKIYTDFLEKMISIGAVTHEEFRHLLLSPSKNGYVPLLDSIRYSSFNTFFNFFGILLKSTNDGIISKDDLKKTLMSTTIDGCTTVHDVLKREKKFADLLFLTFDTLFEENIIGAEEYLYFLLKKTRNRHGAGYCITQNKDPQVLNTYISRIYKLLPVVLNANNDPKFVDDLHNKISDVLLNSSSVFLVSSLHIALQTKNMNVVENFLACVGKMVKEGIIKNNDFKILLLRQNKSGYSPLLQLLKLSNDPQFLNVYINTVKNALTENIVTPSDLKTLLTLGNFDGLNPLLQTLQNSDIRSFRIINKLFEELMHDHKAMTHEEYTQVLMSSNNLGYSALHEVADSNNWELFQEFYNILKDNLSEVEFAKCLHVKTKSNSVPFCLPWKQNAKRINRFLDDQRKSHPLLLPVVSNNNTKGN